MALLSLSSAFLYAQKKPVTANLMLTGKAIYAKRCMTCHQVDGSGAQNMIPPLVKTGQVLGNKTQLVKIILNGMNGEIRVNGDVYAGEMPAQRDLTDKEIAAVLTYIRNSFGNKASGVTAGEVRIIRASNNK